MTIAGSWTPKTATGWMWDLTVTADHDFYVSEGDTTAILVHNCSFSPGFAGRDPAYLANLENRIGSPPPGL